MKSILFPLMGIVLLLNACIGTKPEPISVLESDVTVIPYDPPTSFDERLSEAMLTAEKVMITFPKAYEEDELPDNVVAWLSVVENAEGMVYGEPLILKGIEEGNDKEILTLISIAISVIQLYPHVTKWLQEKRTEQLYAPAKNYNAALCYERPDIDGARDGTESEYKKVIFLRKQDNASSIPQSCYYNTKK